MWRTTPLRYGQVIRLRVQQEAQHPTHPLAGPADKVGPVEVDLGEDAERVVPVPWHVLVVDERLDDEKVLRGHQGNHPTFEGTNDLALEHLVVEIDVAIRAEDDVDQLAPLDRLEQPVGVSLLSREAVPRQHLQHGASVAWSHEQVDIAGQPGTAHR